MASGRVWTVATNNVGARARKEVGVPRARLASGSLRRCLQIILTLKGANSLRLADGLRTVALIFAR